MSDLSVAIVAGLHAEARRATVARLLHDVPGSVVLHHDLATATAGTVVRTVRDATGILDAGETPSSTTARAARSARTWSPNCADWPTPVKSGSPWSSCGTPSSPR